MKNLLFLLFIICCNIMCLAQRSSVKSDVLHLWSHSDLPSFNMANSLGKSTADGDTFITWHIGPGDTLTNYFVGTDSGYVVGTNSYGDKAFAERYDFDGIDSSVKVVGVVASFSGRYTTNTTKTVNFKVWSKSPVQPIVGAPNLFWSGFPDVVLASHSKSIAQIGIGTGGQSDTINMLHYFTTPSGWINDTFFVGYEINYMPQSLNGDTISLYSTQPTDRDGDPLIYVGADTIADVVNVTQFSDNTWNDNFQSNFFLYHNLAIFPIYEVDITTGIGITHKNFTLLGSYPEPATDRTNIRYTIKKTTNISIQVMDMLGKTLFITEQPKVTAGEHEFSINTADLPTGKYIYLIHTSEGDGMAAQFSTIH